MVQCQAPTGQASLIPNKLHVQGCTGHTYWQDASSQSYHHSHYMRCLLQSHLSGSHKRVRSKGCCHSHHMDRLLQSHQSGSAGHEQ